MSTPAHAIVNLLVLGRDRALPVALGAIAPDIAMFLFYTLEKLVLATPERLIWSASFFAPSWQALFDGLHSFPLIATGIGLASWRGSPALASFFSSMALHSMGDFFLHHDDAHRHFFPLSDWRFESPVSYWDPRYHGSIVGRLEIFVVLVGALWLVSRHRDWRARVLLGGLVVLYASYVGYAITVWG